MPPGEAAPIVYPSLSAESLRVALGVRGYLAKGAGASGETAFGQNTGVSRNPGQDYAYLIDSPGNDTFVGGSSYSYMYTIGASGGWKGRFIARACYPQRHPANVARLAFGA